jgi:NAD(P)-dependent dehydrogenase (short-subunit alcohol dehydrogenase family)
MSFAGQVVAVTGAAGGIGRALCRHFAAEGATIAAIDKSAAVEEFVGELKASKTRASAQVADVGVADEVMRAFSTLTAELGSVDILINNAGFSEHPTFARTDP